MAATLEGQGALIEERAARDWWVYVLACADGTHYTGITTDPDRRLAQHNAGRGACYTRTRRPVSLVGVLPCPSHGDALRLERRMKRLPPAGKLKLVLAETGSEKPA
ncbi:MAG: GIY-YIG nuclease family protein [Chloroflexi bacterium]|nr:GIY-YIG nuclease family protein [Chloroflexota bacterium]MCL5107468.1 GIY-YIG nuclease family protein [Chloroflexota bacterium]